MEKVKVRVNEKIVNATYLTDKEFKKFREENGLIDWKRVDIPTEAIQKLGITPPDGFVFAKASGGDVPSVKYPTELIGIDLFRRDSSKPEGYKTYHAYGELTSNGVLIFRNKKNKKDHVVDSIKEFEAKHDN